MEKLVVDIYQLHLNAKIVLLKKENAKLPTHHIHVCIQ